MENFNYEGTTFILGMDCGLIETRFHNQFIYMYTRLIDVYIYSITF